MYITVTKRGELQGQIVAIELVRLNKGLYIYLIYINYYNYSIKKYYLTTLAISIKQQ